MGRGLSASPLPFISSVPQPPLTRAEPGGVGLPVSSQTRACGTPAGPLNLGIQDLLVVGGGVRSGFWICAEGQ